MRSDLIFILLALGLVTPATSNAQNETDFTLPSFDLPTDAGLPPPPLMPTLDGLPPPIVDPPPPPGGPTEKPDEFALTPPKGGAAEAKAQMPQGDPFWNKSSVSIAALGLGNKMFYIGAELVVLATTKLGVPAFKDSIYSGWLFMGGVSIGGGGLNLLACGEQDLCASRISGGGVLKFGWGEGQSEKSGATRIRKMYFVQTEVLLGRFVIPPAPLTRNVSTWELVTRLRLGYQGLVSTFHIAAVVEVIPVSLETKGISFGLALGFAF
jgi:hypothetical protein